MTDSEKFYEELKQIMNGDKSKIDDRIEDLMDKYMKKEESDSTEGTKKERS